VSWWWRVGGGRFSRSALQHQTCRINVVVFFPIARRLQSLMPHSTYAVRQARAIHLAKCEVWALSPVELRHSWLHWVLSCVLIGAVPIEPCS
jgi:hypothetical protein